MRTRLASQGIVPSGQLPDAIPGRLVTVAGLVLVRQRPGTASGVIFATLEDETGIANIVIWPKVFEANRRAVLGSRMLAVRGQLQREGLVIHIIARELIDMTPMLLDLAAGRIWATGCWRAAMRSGRDPHPDGTGRRYCRWKQHAGRPMRPCQVGAISIDQAG